VPQLLGECDNMLCILRVVVDRERFNELRSGLKITPYRIDSETDSDPGRITVHYDVLESDSPFERYISDVLEVLELHKPDLDTLRMGGAGYLELDLAVDLSSDKYASNFRLRADALSALARYGVAMNIALYQTAPSDTK